MKKMLFKTILGTALVLTSGFALAAPEKPLQFAPVSFFLTYLTENITINSDGASVKVFIALERTDQMSGRYYSGVNIQGCGSITHVDAGSSVVCSLNSGQKVTFASDQAGSLSQVRGVYQVERI